MTHEVVKLEDVWVHYNGVPALEDVNLAIGPNDFLGIIGPNGGGKTTLLKVILGLVQPSHGSVSVLGQPPAEGRRRIGYVPQHHLFDHDFPIKVWDVTLMGCYARTGLFRRYGREARGRVRDALATMNMLDRKDRQIGELSDGEQQRVLIARALVADPAMLLLDEPTASVDSAMQTEFYELLDSLKRRALLSRLPGDRRRHPRSHLQVPRANDSPRGGPPQGPEGALEPCRTFFSTRGCRTPCTPGCWPP